MIRVFVIAGVRLYREGLAAMLPRRDEITLVGTAESWAACADVLPSLEPDVVLLDMAVADGSSAIREIVNGVAGVNVIALAVSECDRDVIAYAEAGVAGYVTRGESIDDLVAAVESASIGQVTCSPRVAAALLRRVTALSNPSPGEADSRLTRREAEIATLLDEGLSNKAIAQRLCIELATVKNHVHSILEKLDVHSRFEVPQLAASRSIRGPAPITDLTRSPIHPAWIHDRRTGLGSAHDATGSHREHRRALPLGGHPGLRRGGRRMSRLTRRVRGFGDTRQTSPNVGYRRLPLGSGETAQKKWAR